MPGLQAKKIIYASLLLAARTFAAPADSLRIIQLENQLRSIEQEKAKQEHEKDVAKVTALEVQVANMAKHQAQLDNQSLWASGDKIQTSIWLSLAGQGCLLLGQAGAGNGNTGLAAIGLVGAVTFDIMGVVKLYEAGSLLKSASNP